MAHNQQLPAHCKKCGSHFVAHTAGTPTCTVCTRYSSLEGNARKVRRDGTCPGLEMSLYEFAEWLDIENREMVCTYCGIPEELVGDLNIQTQAGHRLQRLGLDRVDGTQGYSPDNIVLACFACNKARSNTFTHEEMLRIGPALAKVWEERLK